MDKNQTQTTPTNNTQAPEMTQPINTDTQASTTDSPAVEMPPEVLESPTSVVDTLPNKDDNGAWIPASAGMTNSGEIKSEELPLSASLPEETPPALQPEETKPEGMQVGTSQPEETPRASILVQTAQMAGNEPIKTQSFIRGLLEKAKLAIQGRKRKKLDKIMNLFAKNSSSTAKLTMGQASITNDEVEKHLHVSDATATRYLSILEKEGKIKQEGKTGKGVLYTPVK